ncbi:similar to Saccharomyces cerevisiae YLR097C HRT3 Putative SCF-ubiquitin ligase F-box protein, based on both genetic and physical interactions and sequence similarity [Maudiozyma barnettii]|uniref:Similar to Saccharomyces cerevisiae YLR097C HRT3 Putative SCF-ubiquitin ligase F-box protein, based on both genetic and physical interactions and sequence similarity n=1 Tax=Maudiozyma barnettii TaxID=61262 RepID=A0A8H2VGZ1_9SACH|nr:SCF ubiquitin ligase complex subunit HRT3 [Kazachstania barnettii]CAB4255476.1 similar to Saccharomyces cerevisiae YLR097C HRT3 Putative SCF-ubiquitin ligase F-box protein, based on both genetic and physical interactions and sequence similarity [Kazachstania barnettii]CAD1783955.1 similar to Saccharomyces cerevisiae YLR097C HRT3 Putative SCF-ubiquitin ligase F-box protein, based on both genetic and physical interactions and sequence similarity [Kazachstania barnettii]
MSQTAIIEELNDPTIGNAISIWEKGVFKERDGSMSDAIKYYREALKVYDQVEKVYRKKLHEEWLLFKKLEKLKLSEDSKINTADDSTNNDEDDESLLPCWIFEMLPNDILLRIVSHVVEYSGESWVNLSLSCSKFNELCFHNSIPYKIFKNVIYSKQVYDNALQTLNGEDSVKNLEEIFWDKDYELMLKQRPYIKFEGVYISVVNYLRYGSNVDGSSSLRNPVHMITYYRYFRFYEDGKVLRLLTTDEPTFVVKYFTRENNIKSSHLCSWKLYFDGETNYITISRSNDKYAFKEKLTIKNQGNKRFQRLKWMETTVEDKEGNISKCSLKNEKPFFFSRVISFAHHVSAKSSTSK